MDHRPKHLHSVAETLRFVRALPPARAIQPELEGGCGPPNTLRTRVRTFPLVRVWLGRACARLMGCSYGCLLSLHEHHEGAYRWYTDTQKGYRTDGSHRLSLLSLSGAVC